METNKRALFLDRDGVVNRNYGYVFEKSRFEFYLEIFEICRVSQAAGFLIIIVTNQSGIGRGFFSEEEYQELTNWMLSEFEKQGIKITAVIHASENPDSISNPLHHRRKPSPSMILEAAEIFEIQLTDSIMIGDNESDMIAAERAGISHRVLIGPASGSTVASMVVKNHPKCVQIVSDIIARTRE